MKHKGEIIYEYENPLEDQPLFGVFDAEQTKFIVTSAKDVLFVDMESMPNKVEIDYDDKESISVIQNIITDDRYFYVLANKKDGKLGYYLL